MIGLEPWLPEKEMFGEFRLRSLRAEEDSLELTVHNDVFCFVITFQNSVSAWRAVPAEEAAPRLDSLRERYAVYMERNTFFRLYDAPEDGRRHYLAACRNCAVDIWSDRPAKVELKKSVY